MGMQIIHQSVIYGYADHSPITASDSGASDLSPWQHIDRIVT